MAKTFKFLLADEIRQEITGKHIVIGLYPDDVIVIFRNYSAEVVPDAPDGLQRLAFLVSVKGMSPGTHEFYAQLLGRDKTPNGPKALLGKADMEKGQSHTLVVQTAPFTFNGPGTYFFRFWTDDNPVDFSFEIRLEKTAA